MTAPVKHLYLEDYGIESNPGVASPAPGAEAEDYASYDEFDAGEFGAESYYAEGETSETQAPEGFSEDLDFGGENGGQDDSSTVKTQIATLQAQIQDSQLPEAKKQELLNQLKRAQGTLELSPDQIDAVMEQVLEVQEAFNGLGLHSPVALQLATEFKKDVEDIEGAAQEAGINLENLPTPPDEKVMNFLKSLGVPSEDKVQEYKDIKQKRTENMAKLHDKLSQQDADWKKNTSNPPNMSDFKRSFAYWDKTDDDYKNMMGVVGEMKEDIVKALGLLGYQASSGTEADQISVDGSILDFFKENEAVLTLGTLQTTLTQNADDFYPAPRNTEMCGHKKGGGNKRFHRAAEGHSGYPKVTYTRD